MDKPADRLNGWFWVSGARFARVWTSSVGAVLRSGRHRPDPIGPAEGSRYVSTVRSVRYAGIRYIDEVIRRQVVRPGQRSAHRPNGGDAKRTPLWIERGTGSTELAWGAVCPICDRPGRRVIYGLFAGAGMTPEDTDQYLIGGCCGPQIAAERGVVWECQQGHQRTDDSAERSFRGERRLVTWFDYEFGDDWESARSMTEQADGVNDEDSAFGFQIIEPARRRPFWRCRRAAQREDKSRH